MNHLLHTPSANIGTRSRVSLLRLFDGPGAVRVRTPLRTLRSVRQEYDPPPELVARVQRVIETSVGFSNVVRPGESILIKPNLNSGDPPPNSTDLRVLVALIRLFFDYGAAQVTVGEGSRHPPTQTRFEMRRAGLFDACRMAGAQVSVFGETGWLPAPTGGRNLRWVEVARPLLECDRLVFACCLKTHWLTHFSISLKHSVGCVRPRHRARLHFGGDIEGCVAEIASAFKPDLVLVDGRSCYTRGGPCYGIVRDAGVLIAGQDRVAVDVTGIRAIQSIAGNALQRDAWSYRQIQHAVALGLGAGSDAGVDVLEERCFN